MPLPSTETGVIAVMTPQLVQTGGGGGVECTTGAAAATVVACAAGAAAGAGAGFAFCATVLGAGLFAGSATVAGSGVAAGAAAGTGAAAGGELEAATWGWPEGLQANMVAQAQASRPEVASRIVSAFIVSRSSAQQ